jgi:NAD(P)-dependent dehydrogenase (short-subunit alcohol dehydrogenase family)
MSTFVKKKIVITGGNSGIGFETAKALYGDGHDIIIGSRNQIKNMEAVK